MNRIDKLNILLKQKEKIFHTRDLALLWGIENNNSLYTAVRRYVDRGVIVPVYKGLYSTLPIERLDRFELGASLVHGFTYLTCESILTREGIINQEIQSITYAAEKPLKARIGGFNYLFRKLSAKYLFNTAGIVQNGEVFEAVKERAIADLLYYNPKYHFDNRRLVNWKEVEKMRKAVGYL